MSHPHVKNICLCIFYEIVFHWAAPSKACAILESPIKKVELE
jgi:hypothetical protein